MVFVCLYIYLSIYIYIYIYIYICVCVYTYRGNTLVKQILIPGEGIEATLDFRNWFDNFVTIYL